MARYTKIPNRVPIKWSEAHPHPEFRKLYKPLGFIVVKFNELERMLTITMAELMHRSYAEAAAIEWLIQNLNNRIQLFYFLATEATREQSQKNPRHAEKFKKMRDSAQAIYEHLMQANVDRNHLLHGTWTGIGVTTERSFSKDRYSADGGKLKDYMVRGITVKLLADEARYIMSVRVRLWDWMQRMVYCDNPQDWPPSLPKKYLLPSPLQSLLQANRSRVAPRRP